MSDHAFRPILLYFLLIAVSAFGGTLVASVITPRATPAAFAWLAKAVLVMAMVVAVTHAYLGRGRLRWRDFGVSPARLSNSLTKGTLGGTALAGAWAGVLWLLSPFQLTWNPQLLATHFVAASFGTIAMGIAEEVGYRSYGMRELQRLKGSTVAVMLPTAIFIAAHVAGGVPWQAGLLVVGSAGLVFAIVMLRTGNLPLVIALHVATNLVQDNLLRISKDSSLFLVSPAVASAPPDRHLVWIAIGAINLIAAAGVLIWTRGGDDK